MDTDVPRSTKNTSVITVIAVTACRKAERKESSDAAAQRHFIGEHVGRDHRLAVTGAGCMEDAVGEGQADQHPELGAVLAHRLQRAGQRAVEGLLLDIDPVEPAGKQAGRGNVASFVPMPSELCACAWPRKWVST